MLGMGRAFLLAESTSQNPGNSLVRWLSKRRAKDAERKTYNENGVKTALRMA